MDQKDLTKHWFDTFKEVHGIKPMWGAKQGLHLKQLIKYCKDNHILDLTDCMDWYVRQEDGFIEQTKWDFSIFRMKFTQFYMEYASEKNKAAKQAKIKEKAQKLYKASQPKEPQQLSEKDSINKLKLALERRYKGEYTYSNLKHAIRLNKGVKVQNHRLDVMRKRAAIAMTLLWGKDQYLKAYNEVVNKVIDSTSLEEKKKKMLTWAKEHGDME